MSVKNQQADWGGTESKQHWRAHFPLSLWSQLHQCCWETHSQQSSGKQEYSKWPSPFFPLPHSRENLLGTKWTDHIHPFPKHKQKSSSNIWAFLRILACNPKFWSWGGKELWKEIFILNNFPSMKQHILLLNRKDCGKGKSHGHLKTHETNHEISNSFLDLCYARWYTIAGLYEVSWFLMFKHVWIRGMKLLFCPLWVLKHTSETQYHFNVGEVKPLPAISVFLKK